MRKREKNKSIIQQVKESLDSQLAIGSSKHADKLAGCLESRIYSWDTYPGLFTACLRFHEVGEAGTWLPNPGRLPEVCSGIYIPR